MKLNFKIKDRLTVFDTRDDLLDHLKEALLNITPYHTFDQDTHDALLNRGCILYMSDIYLLRNPLYEGKLNPHEMPLLCMRHLSDDEITYLIGVSKDINKIAKKNIWPTYEDFTVEDALERVAFIKNNG